MDGKGLLLSEELAEPIKLLVRRGKVLVKNILVGQVNPDTD